MDYLTAWREGHEAGVQLTLKIISELTQQEFKKASEIVLYIKQLEGETDFKFPDTTKPVAKVEQKMQPENVELSAKEEKMINSLANRIATRQWFLLD
jgi:hypothetical protein